MTPAAITPAARKQAARNGTPKAAAQTTARPTASKATAATQAPSRSRTPKPHRAPGANPSKRAAAPSRPRRVSGPTGGRLRRRSDERRHDRRPGRSFDQACPPEAHQPGNATPADCPPGDPPPLGGLAWRLGARARARAPGPSAARPDHPRTGVDPTARADARRDRRDAGRGAQTRREHRPLDSAQLHASGAQRGAAGERRLAHR